jgi:hypothetical protein
MDPFTKGFLSGYCLGMFVFGVWLYIVDPIIWHVLLIHIAKMAKAFNEWIWTLL